MDAGTIVAIVAVLIFYMRMIGMQWGKAKRLRQQRAQQLEELQKKKGKKTEPQPTPREALGVQVRSWPMVISGIVLCVASAVLAAIPATQPFWWIPITVGMVILTFSFK